MYSSCFTVLKIRYFQLNLSWIFSNSSFFYTSTTLNVFQIIFKLFCLNPFSSHASHFLHDEALWYWKTLELNVLPAHFPSQSNPQIFSCQLRRIILDANSQVIYILGFWQIIYDFMDRKSHLVFYKLKKAEMYWKLPTRKRWKNLMVTFGTCK